jgi:RNA polymerase sigma factor (sigma-70 family)
MSSAQTSLIVQHLRRLAGPHPTDQLPDAQLLERFRALRDQAAFAELVRRHGPMVLNVCRSVLRHEQDAEDAFQATFLLLARKAAAVRRPEALAGFLYEVAHRVALRAQGAAARRRDRERSVIPAPSTDPTLDMTVRDLHRVLHEELRRLPDRYRVPLVLCYLEGRSQEEAAGQLGWSKGTFRGRLDRGREHLRRRLAARGVALSALLCAATIAPRANAETLVGSVVQAAVCSATDGSAGILSARVTALAEGVSRAMILTRIRTVTAVLLTACLIAGVGALAHHALAAPDANPTKHEAPQAASAPAQTPKDRPARQTVRNDRDAVTYAGRVLGPGGKPVAGASIYYHFITRTNEPIPVRTRTDADGRFSFTLTRRDVPLSADATQSDPLRTGQVVAKADGLTFGWQWGPQKTGDLVLQLYPDDAPIEGRILDLEGRPLAGVRVSVLSAAAPAQGDLAPFVKAVQEGQSLYEALFKHVPNYLCNPIIGGSLAGLLPATRTDAEGRFRLHGFAPDRLVELRVEGPAIETQNLYVLNRAYSGTSKRLLTPPRHKDPFFGPDPAALVFWNGFGHAVAPGQVVTGTVREAGTGRPIAGAVVETYQVAGTNLSQNAAFSTVADRQGHYQLTGLPRGKGNRLRIRPGKDQPHFPVVKDVPPVEPFGKATVDVELARGVWVDITATDKATGRPVPGYVSYFILPEKPDPAMPFQRPFGDSYNDFIPVANDGRLHFVALPRKAIVAFRANWQEYPIAREAPLMHLPSGLSPSNFQAFTTIEPKPGDRPVPVAFALDKGHVLKGKVLGPGGKPLAGALAAGLRHDWYTDAEQPLATAEFTVLGLDPARPRLLCFAHPEKKLAGSVIVRGDEKGPVVVRLQPWAGVTGRLLDAEGKPVRNAKLAFTALPETRPDQPRPLDTGLHVIDRSAYKPSQDPATDAEGRFRVASLVPGVKYNLAQYDPTVFAEFRWTGLAFANVVLKPGETRDLGDVRLQPFPREKDR